MDLAASAFKHGVTEPDIAHAMTHAMTIDELDDDLRLYLGPDRNAALLEVISVIQPAGEPELVIHAMPMRDKYRRLLPRGE